MTGLQNSRVFTHSTSATSPFFEIVPGSRQHPAEKPESGPISSALCDRAEMPDGLEVIQTAGPSIPNPCRAACNATIVPPNAPGAA